MFNSIRQGYYCRLGASVPNPDDDSTGWGCSAGHYCPEGTATEVDCPEGTFNDGELAQDSPDCQDVPPGKFSSLTGATTTIFSTANPAEYGPCDAGYICYGGSSTRTPDGLSTGELCPIGKYCPVGTHTPLDCPVGTFQKTRGAALCTSCEKGSYCPDTELTEPLTCSTFHYCPTGSSRPVPCPPGTYSTSSGVQAKEDCLPCGAGIACETPATSNDNILCAEGYVCGGGSAYAKPMYGVYDGATIPNGFCPEGSYCGDGYGTPMACQLGTYQDAAGASKCKPCPRGYACGTANMIEVKDEDKCDAGYFCNEGASIKRPDSFKCSVDHYCVQGATYEMMCEDGKYQLSEGKGECDPCPAGELCNIEFDIGLGTQVPKRNECPGYYYCPEGSGLAGLLCEPGSMSTVYDTGLKSASECVSCSAGYYCVDSGKDALEQCAAGYYCKSGAKSPTPKYCPPSTVCDSSIPPYADPEEAYLCPPGHYCGLNTFNPTQCEAGKFRLDPGAMVPRQCTNCLPGQYCVKTSTIPIACPKGSYCPLGSSYYKECPIGTYNQYKEAKYAYACELCPPKYYCEDTGVGDLIGYECPPSSYCPLGTVTPILCLAGYYIEDSGETEDDCKACSTNFYCPPGAENEEHCPDGNECPQKSPAPAACEAGYCCYW